MDYNERICEERHKRIDELLKLHNDRLNAHSTDIDSLNEAKAEDKNEIKNLLKSLDTLGSRLDKIVEQNFNMQKTFIASLISICAFMVKQLFFP
jgi:uncharacterized coiled-coil protein SlyX